MIPLGVIEIQSFSGLLDVNRIPVSVVLKNKLFEVEERPLMRHLLSNLHRRLPGVVSVRLGTLSTLLRSNHVFYLE